MYLPTEYVNSDIRAIEARETARKLGSVRVS